MDNNRSCSFIGCNSTSTNKNCCFYEFPEDFNLCIQWVEIIGYRDFFEDFAFQGPESFRGKFICSDHFTEDDFIDNKDIFSGLRNYAVPFYFIPNRKPEGSLGNITVKTEPRGGDLWDTNDITSSSIFPVDMLSNVKVEDVSSQFISSGALLQSTIFNFDRKAQTAARRCVNETPDQLAERKMETPGEKEMRRKANAERQARKRLMETPEQREIRRVKDVLRARQRRRKETEEETKKRRLYDAARAQARRNNETEEEKMLRRIKDLERVTNRRRNETNKERMERLKKNREYSAKRRYIQKLEQESNHPKNVIDDTYLTLRNFEQDVTAISANFFQSLATYSAQQKYNNLRGEISDGVVDEEHQNTAGNDKASKANAFHFNNLAYSHFLLNSSQDSQSLDGTSEESMRSYSNDSSDNQVDDARPNGAFENHTSDTNGKSFLQT